MSIFTAILIGMIATGIGFMIGVIAGVLLAAICLPSPR